MLEKMFAADRFLLTLCLFTGLTLTLGWFLKDAAKGALEEPLKLTRAWLISAISVLMTFALVAMMLFERALSYFFDFDYLEWVKGVSKTEQ